MAKPTSFRRTTGAGAFRVGAGHVPWRNPDRIRGGASESFRKASDPSGKKSGKGGGMFAPSPRPDFAATPRPAFGRAAQHLPAHATPHRGRAEARYRRAARTAAELLPELPAPGESVHALMTGTFDLAQVVTATVPRLPACRHLRIATLCFSKRNAAELLSLLDARPDMALTLLVSVFFRDHNKALFESFAADLTAHPAAHLAAARSHCKVVCFDAGDGDALVFEGSANLRTNKNREQVAVFRDRPLHDWHAAWIDELVSTHAGQPGQP